MESYFREDEVQIGYLEQAIIFKGGEGGGGVEFRGLA